MILVGHTVEVPFLVCRPDVVALPTLVRLSGALGEEFTVDIKPGGARLQSA